MVIAHSRSTFVKAEGEGFEPPVGVIPTTVFKTVAIVHSAIPPERGNSTIGEIARQCLYFCELNFTLTKPASQAKMQSRGWLI